jgi:hypothetical protein
MDSIASIISSAITEVKSFITTDIPSGLNSDNFSKQMGIDNNLTPANFINNATDAAKNLLLSNWALIETIANTLVTTQDTLLVSDIMRINSNIGYYSGGPNFTNLLTQ